MKKINFKKWAFRFTIWILIINIITFYMTINYVDFQSFEKNTGLNLFYFGILNGILMILSVIFVIMSSVKKEKRNYQYWISIIGIVIFGIIPLTLNLI
jgi:CDP-diglyceride synthetase